MKVNIKLPDEVKNKNKLNKLKENDIIIKNILNNPVEDIDSWVDDNINNLNDVKEVLKSIIKINCINLKRNK